jgi:AcrR family transcriptional regulator
MTSRLEQTVGAKIVDKKEKKDRILEAVIRQFAKNGFSRTTIKDIALAAGMGKGTVYEYFSNKEEIVREAFRYFMRQLEPDFKGILISEIPAGEKLRQMIEALSHFIDSEFHETTELMFDFWSECIKDKKAKGGLFKEMTRFYQDYREIFAGIISAGMEEGSFRKDIHPRSAAAVIVGTLDGLLIQWILEHETLDFRNLLKTVATTVLNGLVAERQ